MSRGMVVDRLRLQVPAALQSRTPAIAQALTQALAGLGIADRLPARIDHLAVPPLTVPLHASDAQIGQALAERIGQALAAHAPQAPAAWRAASAAVARVGASAAATAPLSGNTGPSAARATARPSGGRS